MLKMRPLCSARQLANSNKNRFGDWRIYHMSGLGVSDPGFQDQSRVCETWLKLGEGALGSDTGEFSQVREKTG